MLKSSDAISFTFDKVQGIPQDSPTWVRLYDVTGTTTNTATGIVVDAAVRPHWAVGTELLITSHTQNWREHQVRKITNIQVYNADNRYVELQLDGASIQRPTSLLDSPDFAVEVALLSRDIA